MATDLRGSGSFDYLFFRRSFLNLTVKKKYENWSTFREVIIKIKAAHIFFVYSLQCQVYMYVSVLLSVFSAVFLANKRGALVAVW